MAVGTFFRRSSRAPRVAWLALAALAAGAAAPLLPLATESVAPAAAQACPVLSGYVYYDIDDDGLKEGGEPGLGGISMQLKDSGGATIAIASTDGSGYYGFDRDRSSSTALQTETRTVTFPVTATDWSVEKPVAQFDPALGTLDSVEVTVSAEITSDVKAESLDTIAQTIVAEVSGTVTVEAPGKEVTAIPLVNAGTFDAAAYDGSPDFAGPSGHDFGSATASDSAMARISDAASLQHWVGTGSVTITAAARATSRTTGSGNALNELHTVAGAEVTVVYRYLPTSCLRPGTYTIVEVNQPAGYGDGQETAGNDAPIPGSKGTDTITVTLSSGDRPNNNFGELSGSLQGCAYVDANDNGIFDATEPGIPGVTVTLGGESSAATATGGDGCYLFPNLPPGTYSITETQPDGFRDCRDTIGTQGGTTGNDRFTAIRLLANLHGRDNNFGECLAPTPTAEPSPTPSPSPTLTATGTSATPDPTGTSTTGAAAPTPPGRGIVSDATPEISPAAPTAGSGFFDRSPDVRIVIVGFAIFAASGWLAFLALGRARDEHDA